MSLHDEPFKVISDYKDNPVYRSSFNRLAELVFGIEFEQSYKRGWWDDSYICHSVLLGDEIIANVSVSMMDITVDGAVHKAIQIGTVMTHPDYRGKGLSGLLMNHVLEKYEDECDMFFLFANGSVHEFYPKYGFRAVQESRFTLSALPYNAADAAKCGSTAIRRLDSTNEADFELMKKLAYQRQPVTNRFGVSRNQCVFMFYAVLVYPDSIYYMPEDETIVVYQQEGETLHLYDVVSLNKIELDRLLPLITNEGIRTIQFHFTPDDSLSEVIAEPVHSHDDLLFIKSKADWNVSFPFCAPKLAHA